LIENERLGTDLERLVHGAEVAEEKGAAERGFVGAKMPEANQSCYQLSTSC